MIVLRSVLDPSPVFAALLALFKLPRLSSKVGKGDWTVPERRSQLHSGEVRGLNQEILEHRRATLEDSYRSIASCERAIKAKRFSLINNFGGKGCWGKSTRAVTRGKKLGGKVDFIGHLVHKENFR